MRSLYQRHTECVGTQLQCTVPLKRDTLWMCSTQQQPLPSAGTDPAVQQPMSVRGMLTICAVTGPAHQQQQPLLSARTDPANVSAGHAYNLCCHGPCTLTVVYNKLSTANLRQPWHCICICSCFSKSTTLGNVCTKVHNTWQCLHCNPQHLVVSALKFTTLGNVCTKIHNTCQCLH